MSWRRILAGLGVALALASPSHARDSLYGTSLRSEVQGGSVVAGNLYVIDPVDAKSTLVGAIHVGDVAVGILAIAAHPRTGAVYGITAGLSPRIPRSLVSIDLHAATASIVARLGAGGSDIGFAPDGTLFMWAPDLHQLVRVDLDTGAVTPVNRARIADTASGGIAIDADGRHALVAVSGAQGTLDTIDLATGAVTKGAKLTGAVYEASIDNLTFSSDGRLYAVNSNGGAPSKAALVIIDPDSGAVTRVGDLPNDLRGLIFAGQMRAAAGLSFEMLRIWTLIALAAIAVGLIAYALIRR